MRLVFQWTSNLKTNTTFQILKNVGLPFINNIFLNKKGEVSKKEFLISYENTNSINTQEASCMIYVCANFSAMFAPPPNLGKQ